MVLIFLILFTTSISDATSISGANLYEYTLTDSTNTNQDSLHIVKKGETLYSIAKDKLITVALVKEWNNLNDSYIQAGQKLIVYKPISNDSLALIAKEELLESLKDSIHVVSKGEYLSGIADKYNISINELTLWNKLDSPDKIYPRQELKLYANNETELDSLLVVKNQKEILVNKDSIETKITVEKPVAIGDSLLVEAVGKQLENQEKQDKAVNNQLAYDFNPGGIKTALNVLVLLLLLVVFIYNIHK